jgi:hypothetical protein
MAARRRIENIEEDIRELMESVYEQAHAVNKLDADLKKATAIQAQKVRRLEDVVDAATSTSTDEYMHQHRRTSDTTHALVVADANHHSALIQLNNMKRSVEEKERRVQLLEGHLDSFLQELRS